MSCDIFLSNLVNEGSSAYVTATFKDKDGNPLSPGALRWRIDDVLTGNQIQDWTLETPGNPTVIRIDQTLLAIINQNNEIEPKRVTVEGSSGGLVDIATDAIDLNMRNLRFYPGA